MSAEWLAKRINEMSNFCSSFLMFVPTFAKPGETIEHWQGVAHEACRLEHRRDTSSISMGGRPVLALVTLCHMDGGMLERMLDRLGRP